MARQLLLFVKATVSVASKENGTIFLNSIFLYSVPYLYFFATFCKKLLSHITNYYFVKNVSPRFVTEEGLVVDQLIPLINYKEVVESVTNISVSMCIWLSQIRKYNFCRRLDIV